MARNASGFAVLACLVLLASAPATAEDTNTLTLVGNVTNVSQTTYPNRPTRTSMTVAVLAGMPAGVTTPLRLSMECTPAMDCYDPWWLSTGGCTPHLVTASIDYEGGTVSSYSCSNPQAYGACVQVVGHLWKDSQGYLTVVPESIYSLPAGECSWKS